MRRRRSSCYRLLTTYTSRWASGATLPCRVYTAVRSVRSALAMKIDNPNNQQHIAYLLKNVYHQ